MQKEFRNVKKQVIINHFIFLFADPSKIIADAAAKNGKASSGSDTDSGSVIIRSEPPQRPSESPTTSSGIVSDIRDGSVTVSQKKNF